MQLVFIADQVTVVFKWTRTLRHFPVIRYRQVTMSPDELAPWSQNVQEEIRKEKLSTYNRLHSIHEDSQFVSRVAKIYRGLPVIGWR
jgi:Rit1 N-terminal domain